MSFFDKIYDITHTTTAGRKIKPKSTRERLEEKIDVLMAEQTATRQRIEEQMNMP